MAVNHFPWNDAIDMSLDSSDRILVMCVNAICEHLGELTEAVCSIKDLPAKPHSVFSFNTAVKEIH